MLVIFVFRILENDVIAVSMLFSPFSFWKLLYSKPYGKYIGTIALCEMLKCILILVIVPNNNNSSYWSDNVKF